LKPDKKEQMVVILRGTELLGRILWDIKPVRECFVLHNSAQ